LNPANTITGKFEWQLQNYRDWPGY